MSTCRPSSLAAGLMLGEDDELGERISFGCHVVIHEGVTIGDDCTLQDGAVLGKPPALGPRSRTPETRPSRLVLGAGASVCCHAVICYGARVGPGAVIGDRGRRLLRPPVSVANDPTMGRHGLELIPGGVTARRGCRVGASAVLLPGIEIGAEAVVGAGAVVTRSVPERTVVMGVPARVVRSVDASDLFDVGAGEGGPAS